MTASSLPWPRLRPLRQPAQWSLTPLRLLVGAVAALPTGQAAASRPLRESHAMLRAFELFRDSVARAGAAQDLDRELASALGVTSDPWSRLFVVEGVGYAAGSTSADDGPRPLRGTVLPPTALLPLHTGFGLALAVRAQQQADRAPLAAALDAFVGAARAHAAPGAEAAMLEAIGFATRLLRPARVPAVAADLAGRGNALHALFWHGVGRSLLFLPSRLLPGGRRRTLAAALAAPAGEAHGQALAGLAWATTLVGFASPSALERLLAQAPDDAAALQRGALAALVARACCDGEGAAAERFLAHRAADPRRWHELVVAPGELALAEDLPAARGGALAVLFGVAPAAQR